MLYHPSMQIFPSLITFLICLPEYDSLPEGGAIDTFDARPPDQFVCYEAFDEVAI